MLNAVVHCSMSVMEVLEWAFLQTLMTEFSIVRVRGSPSSKADKFLGNNFDSSKNSPDWISLT